MKKLKVLLLFLAVISLFSCKKTDSSYDTEDETEYDSSYSDAEPTDAYPDGTYCAEVDYYNPNTGTSSTYTLNVEVENNELTVIQWPNGGWLDSSHFTPEELDSDGTCSITSDVGSQYDIQITGSECSFTDDIIEDESEDDSEAYNSNAYDEETSSNNTWEDDEE